MPHSSLPSDATHPGHASDHFDHLCAAQTLRSILTHYRRLCTALDLRPARFPDFYPRLKASLQSWKAQGLLAKFDKRASHKCYNQGYACVDTKVLVIGAGPCGLRAAIEAQLLGAKVVVLEKRDRFSRNNVLHLWPMVIHDLKALGAKKFFGKFCAGAIDHISIRQLQCILLKVALLLGVEVHENVGFEELIEPSDEQTGWRARLSPPDHPAASFQFDVLIGADGKRNTFKCFRRKEFRGKLAIAITANFVNRHTEAEARVDEISGVAFIFNQKFFKDLSAATGIDLENIVYYKDETHYFVMTAKKHSLLAKGVILQDYMDTGQLLSPSNIDRARLMDFAREAADFSTDFQLPELKFAVNHYGLEDLAMFDFTCMYASCYASTAIVRHGHGLLLQLVGDSLLEPFWPTGSGCARGFLSCFDAGWQIRSWANPRVSTLECLAERESTYRLLAQTTPKNLSSDLGGYSLDPRTRYPNLNLQSVLPHQVRHMVDTDSPECLAAEAALAAAVSAVQTGQPELPPHKRPYRPIEPTALLRWCRRRLQVEAADLSDAFQSGEAICGLLRLYRPELLQPCSVSSEPLDRWRLALRLLSSQLPVPHGLTAELLAEGEADPEELLEFLSRVYDALHGAPPAPAPPRPAWLMEMVRGEDGSPQRASPIRHTPEGRHAANGDTMRRYRKRKNDAAHQKASRVTPEVKKNAKQAEPELSKKEQFASKVKDLEAKFSGTYQPPDKKPKPVSRVIGRIEKDWNLQQIEKKIEENSRPFVNRDKDYPVPRWNRDAFDDKFQTIQSLSGGDVIPFRRFDYGQRGSNHVSAMAARFGNSHRPAAAAPAQVRTAAPAGLLVRLRSSARAALGRLRAILVACVCYTLAMFALTLVVGDALRVLEG
ncbi:F-actin-monooxygenase Mical-like isoform X2 [Amphibalanus amphitrite]|uniref:F-actin-monooxygenase Mical-like isoform X2 n=1 Tax=Amphibalanus amphitrite TaxID=1232801 RepID=UPI001C926C1C|nr:F-actin-monooxygenase Mical-like isoform X2 [Amphibalanus amphitrite]